MKGEVRKKERKKRKKEDVGKLAKHQQKGAGNFLEFRKFRLPIFGRYFKVLWTVFSIQFQSKRVVSLEQENINKQTVNNMKRRHLHEPHQIQL